MRKLIPEAVLGEYKLLFLSVPAIEEWHLPRIDFSALPSFSLLNSSIRSDYVRPVSLSEHRESSLLFTDKLNNHSLYSLMAIQSGKTAKKGVSELTEFEVRTLFEAVRCFFKAPYPENVIPRFSYNHDPHTLNRAGLQSIERFHAHFYLLSKEDLLQGRAAVLKEIIHLPGYKDYFDPAAECFESALLDLHRQRIKVPRGFELIEESLYEKIKAGRGLGLNLNYSGSPGVFTSEAFLNYLLALHREAQNLFSSTETTLFSETTKKLFRLLLEKIQDLSPTHLAYIQEKKTPGKNLLAYRSFCYSFSIDLLGPDQYQVNIYPRLFSEIGGAGIFAAAGYNAVVIERNGLSYFTNERVEKRRAFQQSFLQRLKTR